MTAQELATAYAQTICGPANGWGQHVHPRLGVSHSIMGLLRKLVGDDECQRLIKQAIALEEGK